MNIQDYISTGILEAYVLGELPPQQVAEVEEMAAQHVEVREEIAKIEISLEELAFKGAIEPASHVKDNLFSMLEDEEVQTESQQAEKDSTTTKEYFIPSYIKMAIAASVILTIVASLFALNYRSKWKNTEQQLTTLIAENQRVAQDYNVVNQKLEQLEDNFDIVNNTDYRKVALKGTDNSPASEANIYWNPTNKEVYLSIQNLQALAQQKQYQLWAIVDGNPVDAGVFEIKDGLIKMKAIEGASAFAVTIEPEGGSKNPTLETMQVMGEVSNS